LQLRTLAAISSAPALLIFRPIRRMAQVLNPMPVLPWMVNSHQIYAVPSFGGSLQPGENLKGTICWKSAASNGWTSGSHKLASRWLIRPKGARNQPGPGMFPTLAKWNATSRAGLKLILPPHLTNRAKSSQAERYHGYFRWITFQGEGQDKTRVVLAHFTFEIMALPPTNFG